MNAAVEEKIDLQILIQLLNVQRAVQRPENKSPDDAQPYAELVNMIDEVGRRTNKPVVLAIPSYRQELEDLDVEEVRRKTRRQLIEKKILAFENLLDACRAISSVSRYYARRDGTHIRKCERP